MAALSKILFPTDFSTNADKALAHAVQLAGFNDGELIVQHVVSDYFKNHPHWASIFDVHELQKFIDGYVASHVAEVIPNKERKVRIRTVISKGKPEDEIAGLAERELVDLIVMGSAKGIVTNRVIRMTNRPVLAVSSAQVKSEAIEERIRGEKVLPHKIAKILVATDFSEHSKRVVEYAFDLKRSFGASIYMLYVIETSRVIEFAIRQGHFIDTIEKMRHWASNQLVSLTPDEFINDPSVVRLVEPGSPGETIASVAFEIGADLTILGTHEYSAIHKRLMGTTADKVLTKSANPILTVKL